MLDEETLTPSVESSTSSKVFEFKVAVPVLYMTRDASPLTNLTLLPSVPLKVWSSYLIAAVTSNSAVLLFERLISTLFALVVNFIPLSV